MIRSLTLTARQREVLTYIRQYVEEMGFPPSRREIAKWLGVSPNAAQLQVAALNRLGFLEVRPGMSRAVRVVPGK